MHAEFLTLQRITAVVALLFGGCSPSPSTLSAIDRQRLNRALTYFIYAQADRQLVRMDLGIFSPRENRETARSWVINGLRVPDRIVTHEKINGHLAFQLGVDKIGGSAGGEWERWFVQNPKIEMSTTMTQLFNDANGIWDQREHLWHLGREYHDDYEWARNQDRFGFFLAFYQDPYPKIVR